jgi:hypothetical protein
MEGMGPIRSEAFVAESSEYADGLEVYHGAYRAIETIVLKVSGEEPVPFGPKNDCFMHV